MSDPFLVFSLPRSRSAWLSVFLSTAGHGVGHDIGAESRSPEDFLGRLLRLRGSCETGAAFAWDLIRKALPRARFAVVLRDPEAVIESLERFGFSGQREEMFRRYDQLRAISAFPGVFTTSFDALADEGRASALHRHCTGGEPPAGWWAQLDPLNIQVDMARWVARLRQNQAQIQTLKAEASAQMANV